MWLMRRARACETPPADRRLEKDLRTLALFIELYCRSKHRDRVHSRVTLKTHDVETIARGPLHLCDDCQKLLAHSFVMRTRCPLNPKPSCKKCPDHCYAPHYRTRIREVMRYSGRRLVLGGRLDYLWKALF